MKGTNIGEFEELVLLVIASYESKAYGVGIREVLAEEADRKVNISAVHEVLKRLEKKGLVRSHMGGATEERGGRRKRLFTITKYGAKVLQETYELRYRLYNQVPEAVLSQVTIS